MRHRHAHQLRNIAIGSVVIFATAMLAVIGKNIGLDTLVLFMQEHVFFGLFIYFVYMVIASVVIPLPVSPLWPVALYLYGFWAGLIVTLSGTTLGAVIAFWLAKNYGKPLVVRMIGNKLFSELEHIVSIKDAKTLLLVRILGNNYFDLISYLTGLSKITIRNYFIITLFASSLWITGFFVAIDYVGGLDNIESFLSLLGIYSVMVVLGTLFWEIYHRAKSK